VTLVGSRWVLDDLQLHVMHAFTGAVQLY